MSVRISYSMQQYVNFFAIWVRYILQFGTTISTQMHPASVGRSDAIIFICLWCDHHHHHPCTYDAIIIMMMTIVICVQCHHHPAMYDAIMMIAGWNLSDFSNIWPLQCNAVTLHHWVRHTALAPEGQSQAGPKGRKLEVEVGAQRASDF